MKTMKYFLVCLLAVSSFSCSEEPIVKTTGDDDEPIIIPPPKPGPSSTVPADSIQ